MEVELGYVAQTIEAHLFDDGFEQGTLAAPLHAWRAPAEKAWLPPVRFGKSAGMGAHCSMP